MTAAPGPCARPRRSKLQRGLGDLHRRPRPGAAARGDRAGLPAWRRRRPLRPAGPRPPRFRGRRQLVRHRRRAGAPPPRHRPGAGARRRGPARRLPAPPPGDGGAGGIRQCRRAGRRGLRPPRPAALRLFPRPRCDDAQEFAVAPAALPAAVPAGRRILRSVALRRRRGGGDRLPRGPAGGDPERGRPGPLPAGEPGARAHPRGRAARRDEGAAPDARRLRRGRRALSRGPARHRRRRAAARPLRRARRRARRSATGSRCTAPRATPRWRRCCRARRSSSSIR